VIIAGVDVPPSVSGTGSGTSVALMSTTTPDMTYHREVEACVPPRPAPWVSSAANQLVEAAQAMLMQCNLSLTEDICDYICQHFTSVLEQEVFPLVVGAVAGAQLAAAHHFIVERSRATHGLDTGLRVNNP